MASNNKNDVFTVKPIGIVRGQFQEPSQVPIKGGEARIEIFPEYRHGLLRIEENSHIWIQMWFHKADRNLLSTVPGKVNSDLPEYGVFAVRAIGRPNPIGLTLVGLERVEDNILYVNGLDAIDGTPVLDIKPYYEQEIVFSPVTPYIRPKKREMRQAIFIKQALNHHQEKCNGLLMGVRMALIADECFGHLNTRELKITVNGSACLADVLQGLTNARFASPPRFRYNDTSESVQSIWEKNGRSLTITARQMHITDEEFLNAEDEQLFHIDFKG